MSPMAKNLMNSKCSQGKAAMFNNNNMSGYFFPESTHFCLLNIVNAEKLFKNFLKWTYYLWLKTVFVRVKIKQIAYDIANTNLSEPAKLRKLQLDYTIL